MDGVRVKCAACKTPFICSFTGSDGGVASLAAFDPGAVETAGPIFSRSIPTRSGAGARPRYPNLMIYLGMLRAYAKLVLFAAIGGAALLVVVGFIHYWNHQQEGFLPLAISVGVALFSVAVAYVQYVCIMASVEFVCVVVDIEANTRATA
jgi:hypothetical protein